jgi:hypothetical protein
MDNATAAKDQCALEAMAHLKQKICLMWGSPELDVFISRLIMDSRDGARQGLPMTVGAELLFLAKTNKIIRAIDLARAQRIPFREAFTLVDEGDQKRLESDSFDNPLVSRDTIVSARAAKDDIPRPQARRPAPVQSANPVTWLGQLIFKLATSKLTVFLIVFVLAMKVLWPLFFKAPG